MKKQTQTDVVFLLDRSGSMGGIENDTIGGYNSYLESQRKNNVKVTTVLFDDRYEMLYDRVDIKDVKKLTNKEYYVRGCTALLDAIGKTIAYMDSKNAKKVLFVITTDGLENASKEFKKDTIKKMIETHKNWEFIYIGADINSFDEGASIGINRKNIANYEKSKTGVSRLFGSVAKASKMMCEEECLDSSWNSDLKEYNN